MLGEDAVRGGGRGGGGLVVAEDAAVEGDAGRDGETGGVPWRGGLGVEVHLFEGGGDVGVGFAGGDEAVAVVGADAVLGGWEGLDGYEGVGVRAHCGGGGP